MTTTIGKIKDVQHVTVTNHDRFRFYVTDFVRMGYVVAYSDTDQTMLRKPKHVNHVAHAIVALFTVGLWLPFWLLATLTAKETYVSVRIATQDRGPGMPQGSTAHFQPLRSGQQPPV